MNMLEVGLLVDRLAVAYGRSVDGDIVDIWTEQLAGVAADVATDAADNLIGTSEFFPTLAAMHKEIAAVLRDRSRERREIASGQVECRCSRGWVLHHDDSVSPCTSCGDGADRAEVTEAYRAHRAKQRKRIKGAEYLSERPADPTSAARWTAEIRASLAEVGK